MLTETRQTLTDTALDGQATEDPAYLIMSTTQVVRVTVQGGRGLGMSQQSLGDVDRNVCWGTATTSM